MNGRRRARAARPTGRLQRGFTYLLILFAVAFMGVGLAAVGQLWSITARRDNEQQLLYAGDQIRRAIESYYRVGRARQFPQSLDDLVLDTRVSPPLRHLRRIYFDPISGSPDWHLLTLADGGIMGVASNSMDKPLKVANFEDRYKRFEGADCYCEWQFIAFR